MHGFPPARERRRELRERRRRLAEGGVGEFQEFQAFDDANFLFRGEAAGVGGKLSSGEEDAFHSLERCAGGLQLAQRLDAGAGSLPALGGGERNAARLHQLEVGGAVDALDGIALAAKALLQRGGETFPGQGAQALERCFNPLAARGAELLPAGDDADHGEGNRGEDRELHRQHQPRGDESAACDQHAHPPRRAQQDREQGVVSHLQLHGGVILQ